MDIIHDDHIQANPHVTSDVNVSPLSGHNTVEIDLTWTIKRISKRIRGGTTVVMSCPAGAIKKHSKALMVTIPAGIQLGTRYKRNGKYSHLSAGSDATRGAVNLGMGIIENRKTTLHKITIQLGLSIG